MKTLSKSFFAAIFPVLISFSIWPVESQTADIQGVWVYDAYSEGVQIFKRSDTFDPNQPGFQFRNDGKLVKRQNVGWCGTPPVSYGNFDGKWSWIDSSNIRIEYKYWGGIDTLGLHIESLDNRQLKFKYFQIK